MSKPSDFLIHYYLQKFILESNKKPTHHWAIELIWPTLGAKWTQSWRFHCKIIDLHLRSEKLSKKYICWCIRFSAIAHLRKEPIAASLENVPDSIYSAYGRKYYHLFKQNVSSAHIKKNHITESYLVKFLINIWNQGKNLHDLRGQNPCKNVDLCNIWPFIIIFTD